MKASLENVFFRLEKEFDVNEIIANNLPVWQFLRNTVCSKILHSNSLDRNPLINRFKKILNLSSLHMPSKQYDYVLFTDSREMEVDENGLYVDKVSQNIINIVGKKLLVVINSLNKFNGSIKNASNCLDVSYFHIQRRLKIVFPAPRLNNKKELCALLASDLLRLSNYNFERDISLFFKYSSVFDRWVLRVRPKVVFVNCGHSLFHQALIYSCNKKKVKTVELQHGLVSPEHIHYSPSIYIGQDSYPKYFLSFSDYQSKFVNENFISKSNIYPIGHYFREHKSKKRNEECFKLCSGLRKKYDRIVLVSSQKAIEDELYKTINVLASRRPNYIFIFKQRENTNISSHHSNILLDQKYSIYDFLNFVDVNLSCFSTSVLEFLSHKTIGILIDFNNLASNYFGEIKKDFDNVFICQNKQQVLKALDLKKINFLGPELYRSDNKENVKSFIFKSL